MYRMLNKIKTTDVLRIPYMGSKSKIIDFIFNNIFNSLNLDSLEGIVFNDVFGGGGSVTTSAVQHAGFTKAKYNELNKGISELFRVLTIGSPAEKKALIEKSSHFVNRDTFHKFKSEPTAWGGLVQSCYSFGNGGKYYLYGKDREALKEAADLLLVHKIKSIEKVLGITLPESFYKSDDIEERRRELSKAIKTKNRTDETPNLKAIESLQHQANLRHIRKFSEFDLSKNISITNLSYEQVDINNNEIVYLDPPYNNARQYSGEAFNTALFLDWIEGLTDRNICVFVSEYSLKSKSYKEIASIDKRGSFFHVYNSKLVSEKLYWNGVKPQK